MESKENNAVMTEFILTTEGQQIKHPHRFGRLALEGGYCLVENSPLIVEGCIFDDISVQTKEDIYTKLLHSNVSGIYNIIFWIMRPLPWPIVLKPLACRSIVQGKHNI